MRLTNHENKSYMIFAANASEVIKVLHQIEIKEHADRYDIIQLGQLGMPVWCCVKEHQMRSIAYIVLISEFEKFADQSKFDYLKRNFFKRLERREAKKRLLRAIFSLPILNLFLKYVK